MSETSKVALLDQARRIVAEVDASVKAIGWIGGEWDDDRAIRAVMHALASHPQAQPGGWNEATVLSTWIDRDMSVGARDFKAGQVTIADILDHAAAAAVQVAENRRRVASMHDWNEGRPGYGIQCKRCGTIMSNINVREDCLAALQPSADVVERKQTGFRAIKPKDATHAAVLEDLARRIDNE